MSLTKKQMKSVVDQWKNASSELQIVKEREIAYSDYDWRIVDALLEIGANSGKKMNTSGLVEMQRLFMKLHEDLTR